MGEGKNGVGEGEEVGRTGGKKEEEGEEKKRKNEKRKT